MPYGDGTGPMGGRGRTPCGRGRRGMAAGRGFWRGRGFGRRLADGPTEEEMVAPPWAQQSPQDERAFLEEKARHLQAMLEMVQRRLDALKPTE